ncbi:MAG: TetR/AcrR family transcriptional regulator [Rhodobacteraceae bacterium]|nr:TetR/AcrR family transcriptional regulator [Paracoccaceae bacterium]
MKSSKHHHGDLRAALIRAGTELIHEAGVEALTIRKVAAKAGVSHAAPAHHFRHLADLRAAIAAEGYRNLTKAMEEEIARAPEGPRNHILAAGRGYIAFARENPGLFHLMFAGPAYEFVSDELQEAADTAYDVLRRISAPLKPGPAGTEGNELLVWSIVHGFASLLLAHRDNVELHDNALELFSAMFPDLPIDDSTVSNQRVRTKCPT